MTIMDNPDLLALYEAVAQTSDQMLDAARAEDWDLLVALEKRCAAQVASIKAHGGETAQPGITREQRVRLLNRILADDREIRNLTQPWMVQLAARLNSAGAERKLSQAYGGQSPA